MTTKKQVELKPCPFCGNSKTRIVKRFGCDYSVECDSMACLVSPETGYFSTEKDAIKAWNKRAKK